MLPSHHLLVQNQQWEHKNNAWHMFKVINKATKTVSLLLALNWFHTLLWSFHRDFLQVNADWVRPNSWFRASPELMHTIPMITVLCNEYTTYFKGIHFRKQRFSRSLGRSFDQDCNAENNNDSDHFACKFCFGVTEFLGIPFRIM